MDHFLEAAALAVLLWRAVLCAVVGALIALLISLFFPALPGVAWFALIGGVWGGLVSAAAGTVVALATLVAMQCILGPLFGRIARVHVASSAV